MHTPTVIDRRVVDQFVGNNGHMFPVIVRSRPDNRFDIVDGHHRFPASRGIAATYGHQLTDKIPAVILDPKAPQLTQSYLQMKQQNGYLSQHIFREPTLEAYIHAPMQSDFNNHEGGADKLLKATGFFGFVNPLNDKLWNPLHPTSPDSGEQQAVKDYQGKGQNGEPGESALTPDQIQQHASDIVSPQGTQKLQREMQRAEAVKPQLDKALAVVAKNVGGTMESRIKNPETVVRKIAQKRIEGRTNYNLKGVNDLWGGRVIIPKPELEKKAIQEVHKAAKAGSWQIKKEQPVDKDTYHAYHFDIQKNTPNDEYVRGEIQIHTPQSLAEATVNHQIRAQYGEEPPPPVEKVKDQNAKIVKKLPNPVALKVAKQAEDAQKKA